MMWFKNIFQRKKQALDTHLLKVLAYNYIYSWSKQLMLIFNKIFLAKFQASYVAKVSKLLKQDKIRTTKCIFYGDGLNAKGKKKLERL